MRRLLPLLCALALLAGCRSSLYAEPSPGPTGSGARATALTQEEIDRVNEAFVSIEERENATCATAVSGFFTSRYDRVEALDFREFMRYFPDDGTLGPEDADEFAALAACPEFPFPPAEAGEEGRSPEDLPVPVHRIRRETVDAALTRYAGITTSELEDTGGVLCLEEYDAFYTFTSDFGPGAFSCVGGEWDEDGARLWARPREDGERDVLTLRREEGSYVIQSFTAEAGQTLTQLLSGLEGEDILSFGWYVGEPGVTAQELAALLRGAAEHPVEHAPLTLNGSDTDIVWSMDLYLAQEAPGVYSGDDALYLQAGLEENIVEIGGGLRLPSGRIWVEDEALYRLLRTMNDTPERIDQAAYAPCRALAEAYYNARRAEAWEGGFAGWELTYFQLAEERADWGAAAYAIAAAYYTDPPEEARHMLAGGMYVDSALRAHGLDWELTYLVTLDGGPAGILKRSPEEEDGPFGGFETREALLAALWTPEAAGNL